VGVCLFWVLVVGILQVADAPKDDGVKNEAEKLFRKMEEKIDKAKSLECQFQFVVPWKPDGGKLDNNSFAGTLFLAQGNKARLQLNEVTGDRERYLHIVSDGAHLSLKEVGFSRIPISDSPKNLNSDARTCLARTGIFLATVPYPDVKATKDRFRISDFKLGIKEKIGERDTQRLEYKLSTKGDDFGAAFVVWLDIKTGLPVKRDWTPPPDEGRQRTVTENYTKLILDEKVDPKKFELPK